MNPTKTEFPTALFRVLLTGKTDSELMIEVVSIPAHQKRDAFVTAHGKRISVDSLLKPTSASTSNEVVMCVYAHSESDVDAAITVAWEAARKHTAQALADAKALFSTSHSKPTITRQAWSPD